MATTVTRTNGKNPFIRKAQAAGKAPGQSGAAPDSTIAPDEIASIRASITSREQAPSQQQQTSIINWRDVADVLGDPFSVEQIPISKLRMMRRDPIIGFGLSFIKTPHIRARWYIDAKDINGPNAQVAAHLDHDLRIIMASLIFQWCNSLDFGFQSIAKRFEFGIPAGTYVVQDDQGNMSEQPIWSEGNIQPIRWKPFVALPPETVNPIWGGDGSFNGIDYDGSKAAPPGGIGAAPKGNNKFTIDLYHSLWVSNERDSNFGSIFGYPRLGYSYKFWWSYWFRWAIADRAFEKKADPSILIYHPQGSFVDPVTGQETAYADYALNMGYRMRSGGVITLPSTPYEGVNGPTNLREWEIDFTKDMVNFDPFDKSFDYLDIGKIRCVTGDTPIDCPRDYEKYPDGIPISEIRQGQLIWCFNENKEEFELRPVRKVMPTRSNAELLKLTLDNGKTIRATPDHKFMLRDGEWCELQDLKPGDRLMPLERDFEPYVKTRPNEQGWLRKARQGREMDLVAEAMYGEKPYDVHLHHKDNRHYNTDPENLEYLSNSEHTKLTNTGSRRAPDFYERIRSGYKLKQCECGKEFIPRGSTSKLCDDCQAEKRWKTVSARNRSRYPGNLIANLKLKECNYCGREYQPSGPAQKWCEDCRNKNWLETKAKPIPKDEWIASLSNHIVVSIDPCGEEDTWDLSIDGPRECHNFVSQGVVLHNSLWIPEQALVEGRGGTSSRNVAAEFDSSFTESQAVISVQIAETINRWIIPQWVAANYPEFLISNGTAQVVIQGFADEDVAFTQQIIQLIGQQQSGIDKLLTMVDLQKILDDAGVPLLDIKSQQIETQKVIQAQQAQSGPLGVAPQGGPGGTVGVIPGEAAPAAIPSATGFSHKYVQPREVIYLSRKDVYGDEERVDIKIKRVPDSDDGVIARFDPEEKTVYLSESASVEDSNRYMAAVGQALVGN